MGRSTRGKILVIIIAIPILTIRKQWMDGKKLAREANSGLWIAFATPLFTFPTRGSFSNRGDRLLQPSSCFSIRKKLKIIGCKAVSNLAGILSIHSDTKTHLPLVAILVCVSQRDNIDFQNNIMKLKKIPFCLVLVKMIT